MADNTTDDKGLFGKIGDALTSIFSGIKDSKLVDSIEAKAAALGQLVQGNMLTKILDDFGKKLIAGAGEYFKSLVAPRDKDLMNKIKGALDTVGAIPKDVSDRIAVTFKDRPIMGQVVAGLVPIMYNLFIVMSWIAEAHSLGRQEASKNIRGELPDLGSVIGAAFLDNTTIDRIKDIAARNGIQDKDIDLLFKAQYATYSPDTVRDLYFRKVITLDQVYVRLREMRYTDKRIAEMLKTWDLIPPITDVIRMAVREAFSDSQVAALGLDLAFPDAVKEWGEKQGLSEYWQRQYWRAHWELPSRSEGAEMLHRGLIDMPTYESLLRALDFSPTWHDKLVGISYNVLTRVDLRRLYELGLIDDAGLDKQYRAMGYSPDDTKLLVEWTRIEYNEEYRNLSASEVVKQYLEGITTEEEARAILRDMRYTQDRIDTMIALASYKRAYAAQTARIEALHKLYLSGQMGETEVTSELEAYNIDHRRIVELLDLWALEVKAGLKLPRFQELTAWLTDGVIDADTFRREMLRNGYSPEHIEMYIRAAVRKAQGK